MREGWGGLIFCVQDVCKWGYPRKQLFSIQRGLAPFFLQEVLLARQEGKVGKTGRDNRVFEPASSNSTPGKNNIDQNSISSAL